MQAAYDRAGNRTSLTSPGGVIYAYGYDAANRLSTLTQGGRTWGFAYDGAGNRTSLTAPNGTSTTYTYLANNWLASIIHLSPGISSAFQSVAYTYDPNGNRLSQTDPSGTTAFTYDPLNRLTQAAHPGTYGTWAWTYDAVGNRTQQIAPSATTLYAYDRNNRLTQAGGTIYAYDPNGNLTGLSTGQTFTYDPYNRLTQATVTGLINPATYTYNGDGLKVRRVAPDGAQTHYYYDGIRPIWETDGAGGMTAQLDRDLFGNLLSRTDPGGAQRYYHPDGLGSTTALTDELGAVSATMLYDAWGNVRANSGDAHGKYRFTGAELDETTGLYHMGARFYDPTVGRWLSEDPVQDKHFDPHSLNFYTYAFGNPATLTDSTGLDPIQDMVKEWIAQGLDAVQLLRDYWGRVNEIMRAMAEVGPSDLRVAMLLASLSMGSTTGGNDAHHVLPMYLGGALKGLKITLNRIIHQAYHGFLDTGGLARQKTAKYFADQIAAGRLPDILRELVRLTKQFDKENGTQIAKQLIPYLRRQGYKF